MLADQSINPGRTYDLLIVGGGIVGLSLAFELKRRNLRWRVALLRGSSASAASSAAGAMLSGFGETTACGLLSEPGRIKAGWRIAAASLWPAWVSDLNLGGGPGAIELHDGTVVILNAISGTLDHRNFDSIVRALRSHGEPFEWLDPTKVQGLRPSDPGRPLQAILIPKERFVDAPTVLARLTRHLVDDGNISVFDGRCLGITPSKRSRTPHQIDSDAGVFEAARVVVASGVQSLDISGLDPDVRQRIPPLVAGSGAALVFGLHERGPQLDNAIRTPNRSFACGLHILPHNRGGLYVGATNNVRATPGSRPLVSDVSFLIQCAAHQVDRRLQSSELLSILTGSRPVSLDTFPLLGETSTPGLWLATGTYRDGFLLSPLIAKLVVDALESGLRALAGGEVFAPERPPLQDSGNLSSAIEQGIDNYIGIASERGAVFPGDGFWEDEFRENVSRRVRDLYVRFGPRFLPPADLLWDLEHSGLLPLLERYYSVCNKIW
jgi:glycine/D-amino acid oxidase-like deaminating enzyme